MSKFLANTAYKEASVLRVW